MRCRRMMFPASIWINSTERAASPTTHESSQTPAVQESIPQWQCLTFATRGEIIVSSGGTADLPEHLTLFSPFLRIHSSFIIGSCLLRIRNS